MRVVGRHWMACRGPLPSQGPWRRDLSACPGFHGSGWRKAPPGHVPRRVVWRVRCPQGPLAAGCVPQARPVPPLCNEPPIMHRLEAPEACLGGVKPPFC